jgi:hypothetical protein
MHLPLAKQPSDENEHSGVNDNALPDLLYHYTTQAGLLGIVWSQELFATKIQYFNDSAEFHLALDLAFALLQEPDAGGTVERRARIAEQIHAVRQANIFAVSLTTDGDLLSQWRAYGRSSNMYAVGLRSSVLLRIAEERDGMLSRCLYDTEGHRQKIGDAVDAAVHDGGHADAFRNSILSIAPLVKHPSFEEENEWRLVTPLLDERGMEFREGLFTPVPYIAVPLRADGESAIREVVVGPSRHRELAIMATAAFLRSRDLVADVRASASTYRDW